jgi:hypothetical protein
MPSPKNAYLIHMSSFFLLKVQHPFLQQGPKPHNQLLLPYILVEVVV